MSSMPVSVVDMDWDAFDPWRIQPFRHALLDHPLLQSEQLVELGKRCRGTTRWYAFNSDVTAGTDFDEAAQLFPCAKSAVDSLRDIGKANAWVLLRHIQADPLYRELVDSVINAMQPMIERKDPGLYYRAGWIFSASPNTATPFHIDRSHVFLFQVRGTKTVYVWDAEDTQVCSDRARDVFHMSHDLSRTLWNESFRQRAHVFQLSPGMGVYMPLTSPHMVETSNEASTTISFTYNTDATRRNAKVHVMREMLSHLGMTPPDFGRNPVFDGAAFAAASAIVVCRGPGGHPPACPSLRKKTAYAVAD
ncbi:MAG TPA: cupin domain-containing protein [Dyella sp.]|uniref:JmjC domain-containing protein n=1 Tax=Dyella sp. TaxID=1869338 RepID=UPI002D78895A|nr:cupin domain-containing protein [Dyella sp.]HET6552660.1 cupin domain-containing protein [Dyella sp.]